MSFGLIAKYSEKSDLNGSRMVSGKAGHEDQVPLLNDLGKDGQLSRSYLIFIPFIHLYGF